MMKLRTFLRQASILFSFCVLIGYCLPFWNFDVSYSFYEIFCCIGFPGMAWTVLLYLSFLLLVCILDSPAITAILGAPVLYFLLRYLHITLRDIPVPLLLAHIAPGAWLCFSGFVGMYLCFSLLGILRLCSRANTKKEQAG